MNVTQLPISGKNDAECFVRDDQNFDVVRRLNLAVWVFDIDNARVLFANPAACALWQADSEAELRSRDMKADMSSTVTKRLKQYQSDFVGSDTNFREMWTLYPNGEPKSVMVIFRGFPLANGRMAMQCEVLSEAMDLPDNLRSAEALLHTDVMIMLFSKSGPALYLNPAARNAFVVPTDTFANIFVDFLDCDTLLRELEEQGEHRMVARVHTMLGPRWYDLSAKQCSDAVTGQPAILLTAFDVSELKEARDIARHLASRDQLTGLYNRTFLQSHLIKLATENADINCAIVFFDVDRFKLINDRLGHDAGDKVLEEIACRVRARMRGDDVIARLGGDEFLVLFENVADIQDVEKRAARLCRAMSAPIKYGETNIDVSVSAGIAVFSPGKKGFNTVLREADIALYASKKGGRNRATVFTREMGVAAKARDNLEISLKEAIENDDFILHYQPRLDIKTGRIAAVEGLVRWQHPEKGIVMPNAFIPVCEETGLIEPLGRRVLEMGVRQAIAWREQGVDLHVSLNASPRQFGDKRLLDTLLTLSRLPGFPIGKIEIEITENVLIGDLTMIASKLQRITEMGYLIAIDDFGTGFSNLSSISRFPLDCLKIDRSFIAQLPETGPIVSLILTLGQQIGATVVSEGVETQDQLDWLAEQNCTQAQGYHISKALPPDTFLTFMKDSGQI